MAIDNLCNTSYEILIPDGYDVYTCTIITDFNRVLLINKNSPEWQKDKLNFICGKQEDNDNGTFGCFSRKVKEETNLDIPAINILSTEIIHLKKSAVVFGYTILDPEDLDKAKTTTDEVIGIYDLDNLSDNIMYNVKYYINLMLNSDSFKNAINMHNNIIESYNIINKRKLKILNRAVRIHITNKKFNINLRKLENGLSKYIDAKLPDGNAYRKPSISTIKNILDKTINYKLNDKRIYNFLNIDASSNNWNIFDYFLVLEDYEIEHILKTCPHIVIDNLTDYWYNIFKNSVDSDNKINIYYNREEEFNIISNVEGKFTKIVNGIKN